jgi:DNA-binding beta-propeller fold protein YncE
MDGERFDALTRHIATRRASLGMLLGTALLGLPIARVAAKPHGKGQGKERDRQRGQHDRARRDEREIGTEGSKGNRKKRQQRQRKQRKHRNRGGAAAPGQCCDRQGCTPGKGKNLDRCCFQDRDLTARNFTGANLGGANFARAVLTAATFSGANLDQTCFVDANTTGTRFGNANRGTAIFCRTETSSGIDNSGCDRGTPCCPTCDTAHPCGQGQVCCDGRCEAGDCCETADCPVKTCQERTCQDHQCVYTPVTGELGPGCATVCCQDAAQEPVCCDAGVTICQTSGVCGCAGDQDCASDEVCCSQQCQRGVCCQAADCDPRTCQERACQDNQCAYTPVSGRPGPGCQTLCCRDGSGQPECCAAGITQCTASGKCRCADNQDCAGGEICCDGRCLANEWRHQVTLGGAGSGADRFSFPSGVAVSRDGQTFWVADRGNGRVSIWRLSGGSWAPLTAFGGAGQLVNPNDVAVAADEQTVWVVETGNHRIAIWTRQADGSWTRLTTFGNRGSGDNQLQNPLGVAVARNGQTVWVADQGNDRVSIWTGAGTAWSHLTNLGDGRGSGPRQFFSPIGVAVADDGQRAWVSDTGNNRIALWIRQASGAWDNQTNFGGSGPSQFATPGRTAVAADGKTIWVPNQGNRNVSVWVDTSAGWVPQTTFGGVAQFRTPLAVAVDGAEQTAWVADVLSNEVRVWGLGCP